MKSPRDSIRAQDDTSTQRRAPPQCDIKVQHMTIKETLAVGVHSYLDITQADGTNLVLEGYSETPIKGGFLNPSISVTGNVKGDNPSTNAVDFDARKNTNLGVTEICADIVRIIARFNAFPENTVPYNLLGRSAPNSNSFAHYLLNAAPDLGRVSHSRRAYGWDHEIVLP